MMQLLSIPNLQLSLIICVFFKIIFYLESMLKGELKVKDTEKNKDISIILNHIVSHNVSEKC